MRLAPESQVADYPLVREREFLVGRVADAAWRGTESHSTLKPKLHFWRGRRMGLHKVFSLSNKKKGLRCLIWDRQKNKN